MKLALLGADRDTLPLLQDMAAAGDRVTVAYDIDATWRDAIQSLSPLVEFSDDWEALLHESLADAVIISSSQSVSDTNLRGEQLRKLAQSGLPLLVVYPACEAIVGFEVEMIRSDSQTPIVVRLDEPQHPALQQLHQWTHRPELSPVGAVEQVIFERRTNERDPRKLRVLLARDMYVLRRLVGDVRRVNALGGALDGGPFHLTVNVEGPKQILGRWSLAGSNAEPDAEIRCVGLKGQAVCRCTTDPSTWTLLVDGQPHPLPPTATTSVPLDRLRKAVSDQTCDASEWMEACRAQEIAEAAERSIHRGRTVELLLEEHSEEGTFKGVMAAGSCLLLMLSLIFLIVGSVIEYARLPGARDQIDAQREQLLKTVDDPDDLPVIPPQPRGALWLRLWPAYPLILFLLLQCLRAVAADGRPNDKGQRPKE